MGDVKGRRVQTFDADKRTLMTKTHTMSILKGMCTRHRRRAIGSSF